MERVIQAISRRAPAVAGTFYPASPQVLSTLVDELLGEARDVARTSGVRRPKALIVPHAGYVYSGAVAAAAYALLPPIADVISRVVLVGPAHYVRVAGLAAPGVSLLATPLGDVMVDEAAIAGARLSSSPRAHAPEHSLEVQLPFVQRVLRSALVVPLLANEAPPDEVGSALEALWGGPETLVIISSDLSHYLSHGAARGIDRQTADRILRLDGEPLEDERACGAAGINGLLWVARRKQLRPTLIDLRSSGDTAGPRDRVVGYGAFAFEEGGGD